MCNISYINSLGEEKVSQPHWPRLYINQYGVLITLQFINIFHIFLYILFIFNSVAANNEDQFISDKRIEIKEKEIRKRESNKKKKYCKEHRHTQHAQLDKQYSLHHSVHFVLDLISILTLSSLRVQTQIHFIVKITLTSYFLCF